jgi:two-component system chemotaxis response regulator CheB
MVPTQTEHGADDGVRVLPGQAYVAPGGWQMRALRCGAHHVAWTRAGYAVNRHQPSLEVLFESAARTIGPAR